MKFGEAVEALQKGEMVQRKSWAEGTFVFRQVPSSIPLETIPKMQSLPEKVKEEFVRRSTITAWQVSGIYYSNQLAIVDISNLIQGYSPSAADALAEDWVVVYP